MKKITTQEVNEKLKLQIKAQIFIDETAEGQNVSYPIRVLIKKSENESLYELRDFFTADTQSKKTYQDKTGQTRERKKYLAVFVHKLQDGGRIYNEDVNALLADEIEIHLRTSQELSTYLNDAVNLLVNALREAYAIQLQNESVITFNYRND